MVFFARFLENQIIEIIHNSHGQSLLTPNRNPTYNRHYFVDILVLTMGAKSPVMAKIVATPMPQCDLLSCCLDGALVGTSLQPGLKCAPWGGRRGTFPSHLKTYCIWFCIWCGLSKDTMKSRGCKLVSISYFMIVLYFLYFNGLWYTAKNTLAQKAWN